MALPLYIPHCIHAPAGRYHFPPSDQPLRIQIEGPLIAIQRLLPHIHWRLEFGNRTFPQPAGPELARLTYQTIYGRDVCPEVPGDLVVQDEYLGWMPEKRPEELIDYYGVTFDHLVLAEDINPEVLQINIIDIEDDNGVYANTWLSFAVDPTEFIGKKVPAVPRCCQKRKGTQDRWRVNALVDQRIHRLEHLKDAKEWKTLTEQ
ncbi:hypothetical protein N7489_011141 [Penicillium chrysogenum]|uniref:Uncharacterized protein n=1 Tax=Penicillium chrysogenum TaxID=5076 RepID=A0ABQ8WCA7_PENCH|nr:uncharacterized protein N7489_011141 [Penicillium chrysogenum]KAJ5230433.1 hypothetical protein N7489_011141 [Penicillium chrysogenum]KAJ5264282.1 hypothetical protein N7505_008203 [Penicillium chrysogenum]KAJ5272105.1 hypothetical protein N7524_005374 [Penicillium chrysogenum]KAJ6163334.1 hypothetical protein N7497_003313 [Penicillium chrysogenum]